MKENPGFWDWVWEVPGQLVRLFACPFGWFWGAFAAGFKQGRSDWDFEHDVIHPQDWEGI